MVNGSAAANYSSGQALDIMDDMTAHVLPPGFGFEWTSTAYQEKLAGGATIMIFGLVLQRFSERFVGRRKPGPAAQPE